MAYEERQLEHPRGEHPIDVNILYTKLISFSWISSVSYQIVRRRQYESGHSFDACQRQSNRDGHRARVRQDRVPGIVPPTGFCGWRTALHALTHWLPVRDPAQLQSSVGLLSRGPIQTARREIAPRRRMLRTVMSQQCLPRFCLFTVRRLYRPGLITALLPGSRVKAIKPDTMSYTFLSSTFWGGKKKSLWSLLPLSFHDHVPLCERRALNYQSLAGSLGDKAADCRISNIDH